MRKLSASALSCYLKSPKQFYYRYVLELEPISQSVATFDHDKLAGVLWSRFVANFYAGVEEEANTFQMLQDWQDGTQGWVPPKTQERLAQALQAWAAAYYTSFSPKDGCRVESEVKVEDDLFIGYLDGWNPETRILHECKSTSRAPQLQEQLWKVQNSIQIKLYAVMTGASGVVIEFAYKDQPYGLYRAPVLEVTTQQLTQWKQELYALAASIMMLGDNPNNYPCHSDGCCITSKNFTAMCSYQALCDMGISEQTMIAFKPKEHRKT